MDLVSIAIIGAATSLSWGCIIKTAPGTSGNGTQMSIGLSSATDDSSIDSSQQHTQCKPGKYLDPTTRLDLRNQWDRYSFTARTGQSEPTTGIGFACSRLREFSINCPAWDPAARSLAIRACAADLDADIIEAEREVGQYVDGGTRLPSIEVAVPDLWPDGRPPGGLGATAARLRELAPEHPGLKRFEALKSELATLRDATAQSQAIEKTCAGLEKMTKLATDAQGRVAKYWENAARRYRLSRLQELSTHIQSALKASPDMLTVDLDELRLQVARTNAEATELQCLEPNEGGTIAADVGAWAQRQEKAIAEEQACRSKDACMTARLAAELASDICDTIDGKRQAQAEVAEIRRNGARFGVIDLKELHDAAERVVFYEQQYKEKVADYRERIRKSFSPTACRRSS